MSKEKIPISRVAGRDFTEYLIGVKRKDIEWACSSLHL